METKGVQLAQQRQHVTDQVLLLVEAEECRRSLKTFARACWHLIEPGTPFVDGLPIEAMCVHLEAMTRGEIKRLLITIPPRHTKSTLCSVIWRVWTWLQEPSSRFLCASYSLDLSTRDNRRTRNLMESDWFQARFGQVFTLAPDQQQKRFFENDHKGYQMATSVAGTVTGQGGDYLVIDDAHSVSEAYSHADRQTALRWFREVWTNRLNSQETGRMLTVGQRVHEADIPGYILAERPDWCHLSLPAEYEPGQKCVTPLWHDPRTEEGELLWPERFSREALDGLKRDLGALGYAAQYQQSPVPPGGYLFNSANERTYTISPQGDVYQLVTPGGIQIVHKIHCWELTTSDVAAKDKEQNDYTVFAHWAITPARDVLLLDLVRGHWLIPRQKEQARQFYHKWYSQRYRALYFEDVGYQSAIGQDLLTEGIPCLEFHPHGDKVFRAGGASIWQEAGKLYFPKEAPWLEDYRYELYHFPMSEHDDQVDPTSMVCLIVREPEIEALDAGVADAISNWRGY